MHLRRLLRPALLAAALLAARAPAHAQLRVDPGVEIGGKIGLRVYVTLYDEADPYVPVTGHRMTVFGPKADTTVARTDGAGVITLLVPPGDYRLVSAQPVRWHGDLFRWDFVVRVRADMRVVDLGPRNAVRERGAAAAASAAVPVSLRAAP
jgi:hypothetical protein